MITQQNITKQGRFKNGRLFGKGRMQCSDKTVEGVFFDDMLVDGTFDEHGTGKGRMLSQDEEYSGEFICGKLVKGRVYNHRICQQQEGDFIAGVLVKGVIVFENGRRFEIE